MSYLFDYLYLERTFAYSEASFWYLTWRSADGDSMVRGVPYPYFMPYPSAAADDDAFTLLRCYSCTALLRCC